MRSAKQVDVMFFAESCHNVVSESETYASVVLSPTRNVLIGVRPEQVAQKSSVRNVSWSHDSLYLLEAAQLGRETSMHAKYFFVNNGCNGETVEAISECFPEFDVIAALTFIVEPVDPVNGSALVVSSQ